MTLGPAKRKRILTKFRKVVFELGRQRLGRDLEFRDDGPVSLLDLPKRDSTQTFVYLDERYSSTIFFRIESSDDVLEEFREMGRVSAGDEDIEREIFDKSKTPGGNFLDRQRFIRVIRRTGLQLDDPRLYDVR